MSRNYKYHNPDGVYFISFAVVEWLDVFTRNEYKDIVLDSLCSRGSGGNHQVAKTLQPKGNTIHGRP
ncbi:MAG: hypothetical protein K9H26_19220 [Prolixibacteraceae bacterium]|nr:hypothetical protein [Prolixibacteraceae bacterium]